MKRFACLSLALGTLLFGGALTASASSGSMATGVSYVSENDPLTFQRVKNSGASFVHGWVRWNQIAPATKPESWNPRDPLDPNYDWSYLDQWVSNAHAAGLTPLLQVYYAPKWANRCDSNPKYAVTNPPCDPDPAKLADFGYAAARRYDGNTLGLPRVRYWQPQNEPNLALFFGPQFNSSGKPVSPGIYRTLLNRFYAAVKSVDPSNKVLSAGLAPNGNSSAVAPLDFARRLFCMKGTARNPKPARPGCVVRLDIFDMHPYTSGGPTHRASGPDNVQLGDLWKIKRLLAAADRAGRIKGDSQRTPLWITEMAWDSFRPDPGGVPMQLLRRWTSEAVFRAWQAGVSHFFWYSLRDQDKGSYPWNASAQAGLYFRGATVEQDRPKPILAAFRFPFVSFPKGKGIFVWGRTPSSDGGFVSIERLRNGRWQRLARVRANSGGLFQGFVRIRTGSNRAGVVRARFSNESSVPFSLKTFKDRPARPFG